MTDTMHIALIAAMALSACDAAPTKVEGPALQECVDSRTGDRFELARDRIIEARGDMFSDKATLTFEDENGFRRSVGTDDASFIRCKVVKQ